MAKDLTAKRIIYVALAVSLLFVSGLLKISVWAVPFTLQTMAVMLAGLFLGERYGFLAAAVYVVMGLLGIPVFAKGGGLHYVLEPSFGYILAFLPGAYLCGILRKMAAKNVFLLSAMLFLVASLMLFIGAGYYMLILGGVSNAPVPSILYSFVAIFLPPELVKGIASALIYHRLKRYSL